MKIKRFNESVELPDDEITQKLRMILEDLDLDEFRIGVDKNSIDEAVRKIRISVEETLVKFITWSDLNIEGDTPEDVVERYLDHLKSNRTK